MLKPGLKHETELGRPTVLVVDDEEPNRQLLAALLSVHGFHVVTARDGASALELAREGGIDLVLLDVMMPSMDGLEVCRRLRGELGLTELIVVFVTALSDRDSRTRARVAGADDFLVKPIDSAELAFRTGQWVRLHALRSLSLNVAELSRGLLELSERTQSVASQLSHLAASIQCSETNAAFGPEQVEGLLARFAEDLARIGMDAKRAATAAIPSHGAPPHATVTKSGVVRKEQQS